MTTEQDIIYTIWKVVRAGKLNQDDSMNERLMRDFLKIHRGKLLYKTFNGGLQVPDDAFQNLGDVRFNIKNGVLVSQKVVPQIIRLDGNTGIKANIDDYQISVLNSEEWDNSRFDRFNKFHPLIKFIDRRFYLSTGIEQDCNEDTINSSLNRAVKKLKGNIISFGAINIPVRAILVNPDDEPGYDFTKDSYPMPNALIEDLINSVNAREFNLFLQTRSDEIGDKRDNNAEYNTREEI